MRKDDMDKIIQTEYLTSADLPKKFAKWNKITEFSSTFDIRSEFQSGATVSGLSDLAETSTIQEIRAALYCEYRRYNHRITGPDQLVEKQAWAAIEWLRTKLGAHANSVDTKNKAVD